MKAFLICPVRGHDPSETEAIVRELESKGWDVHWPHRDTDQNDDIGLRICMDNCTAILAADRVFLVYDPDSKGSHFDMGMAFALHKPITVLRAPEPTPYKSFQNVVRAWED